MKSQAAASSQLSSARYRNVVKMEMHNYTKFPVFYLMLFSVLYLLRLII